MRSALALGLLLVTAGTAQATTTIFLNRDDGQYSGGWDDARRHVSSSVTGTVTVSGWKYGDKAWNTLLACVQQQYARFDVDVVDVDPGPDVDHLEMHVGGTAAEAGMDGYGGIGTYAFGEVVPNGVGFTFSDSYPAAQGQMICDTAVQEIGHMLGLDHAYDCREVMSYQAGCPTLSFVDADVRCGEYEERDCFTGERTQNSVRRLTTNVGAFDGKAPVIKISEPGNWASKSKGGFRIKGSASDDSGIDRVELLVDGVVVGEDRSAPYSFTAPSVMAEGRHVIALRASAKDGGQKLGAITVRVGSSADDGGELAESNGGCAAGGRAGGIGGAWLLLLGLGLRRRGGSRRRAP